MISPDPKVQNILTGILSNSLFFFIAYLFYDLIKQAIVRTERKSISDYIQNKIGNDIFVAVYNLKKIVHGYNLETNTLKNIFQIIEYSKQEIENSVRNQNYLGFQIFKKSDEIRSLFQEALTDNFILKYSSHTDSISLLKISNNLSKIESILKSELNYNKSAEKGIEYLTTNGKDLNPENENKFILLKRTKFSNRFVVYDSGFFDMDSEAKLLNRYTLRDQAADEISNLLFDTFSKMKYWLPKKLALRRRDSRFRIIKEFLNSNTFMRTGKTNIYVADIVDLSKKQE